MSDSIYKLSDLFKYCKETREGILALVLIKVCFDKWCSINHLVCEQYLAAF